MKKINVLALICLMSVVTEWANAQHYYLEPLSSENNVIGLRIGMPLLKDASEISTLSGVYSIYTRISFKNRWSVLGEVPIIVARVSDDDFSESDTGLGNLFVGVTKGLNKYNTSNISFGAYLPTVGEDNFLRQGIGILSNPYRISQSVSAFSLYGNYSFSIPLDDKGIFGFEVGPDIQFPTETESETEFWIHLGLKAGHRFNKFDLWAELNTQYWLSESDLDGGDKTFGLIGLAGQLNLGKVNPGLYYGIPLNKEIREGQGGLLGLSINVNL